MDVIGIASQPWWTSVGTYQPYLGYSESWDSHRFVLFDGTVGIGCVCQHQIVYSAAATVGVGVVGVQTPQKIQVGGVRHTQKSYRETSNLLVSKALKC